MHFLKFSFAAALPKMDYSLGSQSRYQQLVFTADQRRQLANDRCYFLLLLFLFLLLFW